MQRRARDMTSVRFSSPSPSRREEHHHLRCRGRTHRCITHQHQTSNHQIVGLMRGDARLGQIFDFHAPFPPANSRQVAISGRPPFGQEANARHARCAPGAFCFGRWVEPGVDHVRRPRRKALRHIRHADAPRHLEGTDVSTALREVRARCSRPTWRSTSSARLPTRCATAPSAHRRQVGHARPDGREDRLRRADRDAGRHRAADRPQCACPVAIMMVGLQEPAKPPRPRRSRNGSPTARRRRS